MGPRGHTSERDTGTPAGRSPPVSGQVVPQLRQLYPCIGRSIRRTERDCQGKTFPLDTPRRCAGYSVSTVRHRARCAEVGAGTAPTAPRGRPTGEPSHHPQSKFLPSAYMSNPNLAIWNLRDNINEELLDAFYHQVYLPAFPIVSEREDPRLWRRRLWGGKDPAELHGLIAGHNLNDRERRQIAGGILFRYLPVSCSGLIDYVVVGPGFKRQGLGRWFLDQAKAALEKVAKDRGCELLAVFMEVNDPRRVPESEDSMNPWARIRFFQGWGAKILDVPYVQPELLPGQGRAREMVLLAALPRQTDPHFIPARTVVEFVYEEYRAYGVSNPEMDADCQALVKAIAGPSVGLFTL